MGEATHLNLRSHGDWSAQDKSMVFEQREKGVEDAFRTMSVRGPQTSQHPSVCSGAKGDRKIRLGKIAFFIAAFKR